MGARDNGRRGENLQLASGPSLKIIKLGRTVERSGGDRWSSSRKRDLADGYKDSKTGRSPGKGEGKARTVHIRL